MLLGPITVMKQKVRTEEYAGRLVAELWFYPDGSRILELSSRCAPANAFQVTAELKALLVKRGLDISGDQQTGSRSVFRRWMQHRLHRDLALVHPR